ncbi:MAG TPA: hypothetical protein VNY06_06105 [Methylocella sp.]|nr:hypothetical protein [Methylocella sp.]
MIGIGRFAAALTLGFALWGTKAQAQDTSLMDMNMNMGCMLMAGMHELQVAVYQSGALDDSCEDLPGPGPAVVTLSSASKELRDLTTEVRIVRGDTGEAASGTSLDPITLVYAPPKAYPTGVITLNTNFDKAGKYTVLATVRDDKDMVMSGHLGITVGAGSRQVIYAFLASGVILAAALGYYLWEHRRKSKMSFKGS